jgi:hypothetical protein
MRRPLQFGVDLRPLTVNSEGGSIILGHAARKVATWELDASTYFQQATMASGGLPLVVSAEMNSAGDIPPSSLPLLTAAPRRGGRSTPTNLRNSAARRPLLIEMGGCCR